MVLEQDPIETEQDSLTGFDEELQLRYLKV